MTTIKDLKTTLDGFKHQSTIISYSLEKREFRWLLIIGTKERLNLSSSATIPNLFQTFPWGIKYAWFEASKNQIQEIVDCLEQQGREQ